jgi:uncharacterized RDD family membrane protein YckC
VTQAPSPPDDPQGWPPHQSPQQPPQESPQSAHPHSPLPPQYAQPPYPQHPPQYGQPRYVQPAQYGQPQYTPPPQAQPPYGYQAAPRPQPTAPDGRPLADFGERLLAFLIDLAVFLVFGLILAIPAAIGIFAVASTAARNTQVDENGNVVAGPNAGSILLPIFAISLLLLLAALAFSYIYEVEMMYRRGATWGKRAMKLRVVPLANPGAPLTRGMAAKRWLVNYVLGGFVPFFRWIDGLWQLWDQPYRQCLHDKWAGTVVVKGSQ